MTTRGQILRSSTPGQTPAAGTRAPGELWTTFPDLQLGVIDASKTAQKLIAVRFFSTTANYAVGDYVVQAGVLYVANSAVTAGAFNASKWTKLSVPADVTAALAAYMPLAGGTFTGPIVAPAGSTVAGYLPLAGGTLTGKLVLFGPPTNNLDAATKAYVDAGAFVPIAGGTMTGDLILNRDAQVPLGAATKEQVDARGAGDNRLINGDMRIDQRNGGVIGATIGYTIDRWLYNATQAAKGSWQRGSGASVIGFPYWLSFSSSSAYTPLATDFFQFQQHIEADMVSDFAWGTASAQPVILSFWVSSNQTGTFSASLSNDVASRNYPFSFSIPVANVFTNIIVPIPGDTGGPWVMSGNLNSVVVRFDLGSGANFRGPANTWQTNNAIGVTGTVSIIAINGANWAVTGVKLEIGSVATPYNRQSLAKSMIDCQRYYQKLGGTTADLLMQGYGLAGANIAMTIGIPSMRAAPTVTAPTPFAVTNANTVTYFSGLSTIVVQVVSPATGFTSWFNSSGQYLTVSAEL